MARKYSSQLAGFAGPPGQPQKALVAVPMRHDPRLGQPLDRFNVQGDPRYADFETIPAWYPITIELAGNAGATNRGSVPLRPEPFVCFRITWCTTGDTHAVLGETAQISQQGRSVEILWGDEFTKFMGDLPALLSAVFGDSNGFLDIPQGLQFQGRQSLNVTLTRILWPALEGQEATARFDIVFQGVGLLPKGIHQSGTPR